MAEIDRIGPYTLLTLLGEGAHSRVWRASDRDGDVVALKVVRGVDAVARLRHEASIGAMPAHPHVVRIDGFGETSDGGAWLAMECLSGARAPLSLPMFGQLLDALVHVHAHGVIHCDIKPANLLAAPGGGMKLADFGIARLAGQGAGPVHGSPRNMSPEQLRGRPLDARSDIFSAGMVLYQLLTGTQLFDGSAFAIMQQILAGAPVPRMPSGSPFSPHFDAVVQRALAHETECRFLCVADFSNAFHDACQLGNLSVIS